MIEPPLPRYLSSLMFKLNVQIRTNREFIIIKL